MPIYPLKMTKDQILNEIRRTAEENGGIPLGIQRFVKETGVKTSDWAGKFWTKWSDAIEESGFEPNKWQEAIPIELLIEKYALFVNELGHIPTRLELRLKTKTDSGFPSSNAFLRLGSKSEITEKLLAFCSGKDNFAELLAVLNNLPKIKQPFQNVVAKSTTENGNVYLLIFGEEYKIGCSNNVERRFRELKTQMPYDGKIIHSIATGDPEGIEAYWHKYFKEKRLKGEWFKLSETDVKYFMKRKLM
jgi:Meiotically up-regulated gene 113